MKDPEINTGGKEICGMCRKLIDDPETGTEAYQLRECPDCSRKPIGEIPHDYLYTICSSCYAYEDMCDEDFEEAHGMTKKAYKEINHL